MTYPEPGIKSTPRGRPETGDPFASRRRRMNAGVGRPRTEVRSLLRALARALLAAFVVWCAAGGTAAAQAVRGTLLGTVHDSQGAGVPGVNVTATETQTNISRSAATNQSGN